MTVKPATAEQYHALILKLARRRGEHPLDALQGLSVERLTAALGAEGVPPVMHPFTLLERNEVQYQVRLTGFEMIWHEAYGRTAEYIGYLDKTYDRRPMGVRLGVSKEHSYIKLV